MEKPNGEPEQILLKDLPKEYYRLPFLVDTGNENLKREMEISLKAGELVGKLYDAILKQYKNPDSEETLKSLNMLCVRLVFCLYAEDAGIFGHHEMFGNYLKQFSPKDSRKALIELFQVLDTKPDDRDPYINDDLAAFPYVNGGLFADENIEIPRFTEEIVDIIVNKASAGFDWSEISPTIFGAVFESTLNPETRRSGGMHYTSIENIHKVIDPLFLDDLKSELEGIKSVKVEKTRKTKLEAFREKLSSLTFLDPACGSGNFLTETYISLRRLENKALSIEYHGQGLLGDIVPIKVGIGQFYGIEINDFAVTVAKTALWIAESQMMHETEEIMQMNLDFLPLKSYANITEGNALRIDWESIVPKEKLNYIMGNPPFVGSSYCTDVQKKEIVELYGKIKLSNSIDYVAGWYYKASELIQSSEIKCAFVSTNSITQGEQVAPIWETLFSKFNIEIDFAWQTFVWDNEASLKAHVHVVIIGFSVKAAKPLKQLYCSSSHFLKCDNINAYLMPAPNVFIKSQSQNLCNKPKICHGSKPSDGGFLILSSEEKDELIKKEPAAEKFVRRYSGGVDFLRNQTRYCLWLVGASPKEINSLPLVLKRVKGVQESRLNSTAKATQAKAETPTLFFTITQPSSGMMLVGPQVSSGRRKYIPFGFFSCDVIASDKLLIMPNAELYHFGVMMSNVHNSWVRAFAGRLKSDFTYSVNIVYNNFPWCNPTAEQKARIEATAQAILDARAKYPECSLADLYDETTMPPELRKAHQANDRAVMQAYGFPIKITESECVAELMKMYQRLTK